MNSMVLVFDLDDTLYNESSYMHSGFKEISRFLSEKVNVASDIIFEDLVKIEKEYGRGQVFDLFLKRINRYNQSLVAKCISIYRLHQPQITLNVDAVECLKRFAHLPLYIVTDGNKVVQRKKIYALGVDRLVKKVYVTHQYGIRYSKPSPYIFKKIVEIEKTIPKEVFYIADNPKKDFIGIRPLGFKTIRILQGMFQNYVASDEQRADAQVKTLDEISVELLNSIP